METEQGLHRGAGGGCLGVKSGGNTAGKSEVGRKGVARNKTAARRPRPPDSRVNPTKRVDDWPATLVPATRWGRTPPRNHGRQPPAANHSRRATATASVARVRARYLAVRMVMAAIVVVAAAAERARNRGGDPVHSARVPTPRVSRARAVSLRPAGKHSLSQFLMPRPSRCLDRDRSGDQRFEDCSPREVALHCCCIEDCKVRVIC